MSFRPFLFDQFVSIGEPYRRLSRFVVRETHQESAHDLTLLCEDQTTQIAVTAHYESKGFVRTKWLEIRNQSAKPKLLLDVELDLPNNRTKRSGLSR